jgi:hypothetical protein
MVPSGNNSRKGSTQITNKIDLTWNHGVDFRESVWELLYASFCPNPEGLKEKWVVNLRFSVLLQIRLAVHTNFAPSCALKKQA